ncbi:hypothetical protein RHVP.R6 [Cricetid gammaherpesvirus 2]|uniref:Uncharacterized protein n=1 Tax=Cricetid gammaherpesvirus 2 TaxID=1605972 RepID=E9M5I5_9GAMA|nr:hypothetical protein RHVP.R6 [Cricetid gammaherpesvirus 2]ADW24343.1 hypothetical protein RHVP.R6 [Cricetid gammaherpesvirus 2]ADW24425.1 hypothetical protein RHVP-L.R6 [Cricetid gammaherpesvirus 2]
MKAYTILHITCLVLCLHQFMHGFPIRYNSKKQSMAREDFIRRLTELLHILADGTSVFPGWEEEVVQDFDFDTHGLCAATHSLHPLIPRSKKISKIVRLSRSGCAWPQKLDAPKTTLLRFLDKMKTYCQKLYFMWS